MHFTGPFAFSLEKKGWKKLSQPCSLWALLWILEMPRGKEENSHKKEENSHKKKGGEFSQTSGSLWDDWCRVSSSHTHLPQTRHQQAAKALLTQDRHCLGFGWSTCFRHQNATLGYKRAFAWTTQEVSTFSCLLVLPRPSCSSPRAWSEFRFSHTGAVFLGLCCVIYTQKESEQRRQDFFLSLYFFFWTWILFRSPMESCASTL